LNDIDHIWRLATGIIPEIRDLDRIIVAEKQPIPHAILSRANSVRENQSMHLHRITTPLEARRGTKGPPPDVDVEHTVPRT